VHLREVPGITGATHSREHENPLQLSQVNNPRVPVNPGEG
jgi:hypothetical protein